MALENAEPKSIEIYADLYATAWLNACEEDKKIIAENCLKDIIFHCLRAHRDSEGRERLGENLLVFLNYFHKHCNDIVKKMICDQYRPLLWKHLKVLEKVFSCQYQNVDVMPTFSKCRRLDVLSGVTQRIYFS